MKICEKCSNQCTDDAVVCPKCGANLGVAPNAPVQTDAPTGDASDVQQTTPPVNNNTNPTQNTDGTDENKLLCVLSFFIPIVGIVLYFVYNKEAPVKAKNCLKWGIVGIIVGFAVPIALSLIGVIFKIIAGALVM